MRRRAVYKITVQLGMALPWFQLTVYVLQLSVYKAREQGTGNREQRTGNREQE